MHNYVILQSLFIYNFVFFLAPIVFMTYDTNYRHLNLFVPDAPFLYPLKTLENLKVF